MGLGVKYGGIAMKVACIMKFGPAFTSPRRAPEWVRTENYRTLNQIKRCGAAYIEDGSAAADALRAANQIAMGR
jgi:hypothetical protein